MIRLVDKSLTDLQKRFAHNIVKAHYGNESLSNTECAIQAGYSPDSAYQRAYELLNPKISPHVVKYIGELKEDFRIKNNIDPDKHMARLNYLGMLAEKNKMVGVALRAEELRGKVAGYYIDRVIKKETVEDLTKEELEAKMYKIIEDHKELLEQPEEDKNE
jgi:hypothetical protein